LGLFGSPPHCPSFTAAEDVFRGFYPHFRPAHSRVPSGLTASPHLNENHFQYQLGPTLQEAAAAAKRIRDFTVRTGAVIATTP
jgi:hypothetical protein